MATNTPRLNLRKPGASDNVDVTADLDANFDILDNSALITIVNTFAQRQVFNDGVDIRGGPTGYGNGEVRFGGTDNTNLIGGAGFGFSDNYFGSPRMYFDHRGAGNTGDWIWRNGSAAANTQMSLSGSGGLLVLGQTSGFGSGAFGAAQGYTQIGDDAGGSALVNANHGTVANASLILRAKGTGEVQLQTGAGAVSIRIGTTGLGFYGHAQVAQPSAPVTLADVIAVIRGCGLSA